MGATAGAGSAYKHMDVEPDIEAIAASVAAGETERFEAIVRHFQRPLFNFILNRVRDMETAEELAQETFLKAYRSLASFDGRRSGFKTWLYRIGLNLCLDHFRRRRVRAAEEEKLAHENRAENSPAPTDRLAQRDQLMRLLGRVAGDEAELLLMRYADDLTYEEMAVVTGLGESTLRSRVHRALRKLQALVAPAGKGAERDVV
ncbi:MAG: sigma-70 family RNA polymerase sigma factor [Candidatus Wallbacteria bacterium]|nr:sigma-70 family RNA polymerase sigma factor [Candidatus Wallbacteria bacterium]